MAAERIYKELGRFEEVYVRLLSQIGRPIDRPLLISIQYILSDRANERSLAYEAAEIVKDEIEKITRLQNLILEQRVGLF